MKKKIIIIVSAIFSFFLICLVGLFVFYKISLGSVGDESENVTLVIESGTSSREIVDAIYEKGLLKNKYVGYVYLKTHNKIMLQAGVYDLNKGMNFPEILEYIGEGKVVDNSVSITFVEGKRLNTYVKQICLKFGYEEEDVLKKISDKDYLKKLIEKYWFLTDEILNDKLYYALEGYLYPDTYQFKEDASIYEIVDKMLYTTDTYLSKYRSDIEKSGYSVHEILSMASIVELEAVSKSDRDMVSQVIHKRLEIGMTLGMDVTTYYAVQKDMSEELWDKDLKTNNPYNTRIVSGLPVGPICNSSIEAIDAVFNPTDTNYIYFFADIRTGKVYFAENEAEFYELIRKYGV